MGSSSRIILGSFIFLATLSRISAAEWENTVSPYSPGPFPEVRPSRVEYAIAWRGLPAATVELQLAKANGRVQLEGSGRTAGLARSLWKFDGTHCATIEGQTLRPVQVHETESVRSKTWETDVKFTPEGVTSFSERREGAEIKSKTRTFDFPNAMSLSSSLLYLRSQPLTDGAVERIVVYPATSAYLSTVTVIGREQVTVPAGNYDAIRLDLQLSKIGKERELKPRKKFKRGTIWISDDGDRLVLRIEAQLHIGTVSAELQSVHFDQGNQTARLSSTKR